MLKSNNLFASKIICNQPSILTNNGESSSNTHQSTVGPRGMRRESIKRIKCKACIVLHKMKPMRDLWSAPFLIFRIYQYLNHKIRLGLMNNELKQWKPVVTRKHTIRPTDTARPDEKAF